MSDFKKDNVYLDKMKSVGETNNKIKCLEIKNENLEEQLHERLDDCNEYINKIEKLKEELKNYKNLPERLKEIIKKIEDNTKLNSLELPIRFKNGEFVIDCKDIKVLHYGNFDTKIYINGKECDLLSELSINLKGSGENTFTGKFALVEKRNRK